MGFAIGNVSFIAAAFGFLAMYANYGVRWIAAWYERREGPKDRVHVGASFAGAAFFIIGSFLQPAYDGISKCNESGRGLLECLLSLS